MSVTYRTSSTTLSKVAPYPPEEFLCVGIRLPHLDLHVRVIPYPALLVQRGCSNEVSFIIVAQLAGDVDRITDLYRLSIAIIGFPRHAHAFRIFADRHLFLLFGSSALILAA